MENQSKSKPQKVVGSANKGIEIILAIVLIVLIVGGVLIFLFTRSMTSDLGTETITSEELFFPAGPSEILEVTDSSKVTINDKTITLPEGWRVISISKNYSEDTQYKCENADQTECTVYNITNNEQYYYIATPTALRTTVDTPTDQEKKMINIGGIDYEFSYEEISVYTMDSAGELVEDSSAHIYKEIHGCVAPNMCVSSGLLNIDDSSKNGEQVSAFESFVKSLIIS